MKLHKAEISDILRSTQRDESFVNELQEYFADLLKLFPKYTAIRQYVSLCANAWYYLLTSISNTQTLGEEYTGTIRISNTEQIPSKFAQIVWLIFYIGGEKLYDKLLLAIGKKVHLNQNLTAQAKSAILKSTDFLKDNKHILLRLHQSVFYMNGTYHNLSNRCTGMKYVLLREWMQDSSATTSFNILGKISFVYLLFLLGEKMWSNKKTVQIVKNSAAASSKVCVLCVENCTNISCTPCGHLFCWSCIFDSLRYQASCPVCREDVDPSRIVLLQNY